ncbi:hypothetical protein TrST_g10871 [Triparma strigata]|uniref:Transcription factor CBF/NF-Y/archaeal histone domain-containing protein n=1 Tax=Triparma strigata TaxID=1606541 RepID=A0A9W7DWG2_9STRA|nr:hypothetical protein TrST_g10871 [Triparma strigata]
MTGKFEIVIVKIMDSASIPAPVPAPAPVAPPSNDAPAFPPPSHPVDPTPVSAPLSFPAPVPAPVAAPSILPPPSTSLPPAPSSPSKPPVTGVKRPHDQGHEFEPPPHCIRKILKQSLPDHATVSKEANAAFTRAAGIFILYLSSCANDLARDHSRTTVSSQDVLDAVVELELGPLFGEKMSEFLKAFQQDEINKKIEKEKQKMQEQKAKEEEEAKAGTTKIGEMEGMGGMGGEGIGEEFMMSGSETLTIPFAGDNAE